MMKKTIPLLGFIFAFLGVFVHQLHLNRG